MVEEKKILLIDDEDDFTELIASLLQFHNFKVDTFSDGTQVKNQITQNSYQLIITDLMMPQVDGFEVIKIVRENEHYQNIPIIVLSAKVLSSEERKFLLENKAEWVAKPFDPHELVEKAKQIH